MGIKRDQAKDKGSGILESLSSLCSIFKRAGDDLKKRTFIETATELNRVVDEAGCTFVQRGNNYATWKDGVHIEIFPHTERPFAFIEGSLRTGDAAVDRDLLIALFRSFKVFGIDEGSVIAKGDEVRYFTAFAIPLADGVTIDGMVDLVTGTVARIRDAMRYLGCDCARTGGRKGRGAA